MNKVTIRIHSQFTGHPSLLSLPCGSYITLTSYLRAICPTYKIHKILPDGRIEVRYG